MAKMNKQLLIAKLKAGLVHFFISLFIFGLVLAWVRFVAYPDVYFSMAGAVQGLTLVFLVDVVLGPLLSFLVYDPTKSKKAILLDFTVIGLVQVVAMLYGLNTLHQEHPKTVVVYHNSSATVFSKREMEELSDVNIDDGYDKWGGLPVVVYSPHVSKVEPYQPIKNSVDVIKETDRTTRLSLSADDEATLENLEKTHGKLYVIAVLAKYNGAYFALNQELQLVAKFGEKPIS